MVDTYQAISDLVTSREKLAEALESMIDRFSLSIVIEDLADICSEKADHIRSNWAPESGDAWNWDQAGKKLNATLPRMRTLLK